MKIRDFVLSTGGTIGALVLLFIQFTGVAIHLFTVYLAWAGMGFIPAALTLFFPFVAEVIWFFIIGMNAGFLSPYCQIIVGYGVIVFAAFGVVIIFNSFIEQE